MSLSKLRQFENAIVGKEIGRGAYGIVHNIILEGDDLPGNREAAAKELYNELCGSEVFVSAFYQECNTIAELQHRNIVEVYGLYARPNAKLPMLVMEKMHTSLHAWLEKVEGLPPIGYDDKDRVMREVVEGLSYLHGKDLVHRDLTARNVLISRNQHESGVLAKIADFGMAKIIASSDYDKTHTACPGTPCYMPPEATREDPKYNFSLDIYSFGVLLVFLLTGKLPTTHPRKRLKKIRDHPDQNVRRHIMLVERCLAKRPEIRPTCDVIQNILSGNGGEMTNYSWEFENGYTPGLNIKGVCTQSKCITHEKDVICDIPKAHFDLAEHAPDIKCPNCGSHIDPVTMIFYQCKWKITGEWWESFSKPAENYVNEGEVRVNDTEEFPVGRPGGKWLKLTIGVEPQELTR